jgi:glycosyltransferase
MTISLITTCFNRANTIERTIQSVLSQDHNNVEYIVIDGASTDGSAEIIERYFDRITHFVSEPDNGMYEAINKGIRLASGDIIGLIHSDDEFYSKTVLSKIDAAFEQSGADIIYGNGIYVAINNRTKIIRNWESGEYRKEKIKRGWLPLHPTVYAKREVFEQCGLYDESYKIAADSDMLVRMLYNHHFKVHYLNEYIVRMSMGGISTSFKSQIYKWKEDIRMYRSHNFNPYWTLGGKILSKIPQFLKINV